MVVSVSFTATAAVRYFLVGLLLSSSSPSPSSSSPTVTAFAFSLQQPLLRRPHLSSVSPTTTITATTRTICIAQSSVSTFFYSSRDDESDVSSSAPNQEEQQQQRRQQDQKKDTKSNNNNNSNDSFLLQDFQYNGEVINPYKILGVKRTATIQEIKQSYHQLSRRYHPDGSVQRHLRDRKILPGNCNSESEVRDQWERIALSYSILKHPLERKRYDRCVAWADPGAAIKRAALDATLSGVKGATIGLSKGLWTVGSFAVHQLQKQTQQQQRLQQLLKQRQQRQRQREQKQNEDDPKDQNKPSMQQNQNQQQPFTLQRNQQLQLQQQNQQQQQQQQLQQQQQTGGCNRNLPNATVA